MGKSPRVAEITLSAAWHAGAVPAQLDTTDGVSLEIIHRGTWSHGLGPVFPTRLSSSTDPSSAPAASRTTCAPAAGQITGTNSIPPMTRSFSISSGSMTKPKRVA
jgi:hypothetical protein